MELAINILKNSLRKDEKILRRYKRDGNEIAYANMLKDVEQIKMAIKILNDCFVPQPKQEVCEHVWRRTGDPDRQSVRCEKCGLLTE